jgi:hypothetical protein
LRWPPGEYVERAISVIDAAAPEIAFASLQFVDVAVTRQAPFAYATRPSRL